MTDADRRLPAYAVALTATVGILAGLVASMTTLVPLDESISTGPARLGHLLVMAAVLTVAALWILAPVFVAVARIRETDARLRPLAAAVLAVVGPPLGLVAVLVLLDRAASVGVGSLLLVGVLFAILCGVVLAIAATGGHVTGRIPMDADAWSMAFNLVVVVVFAAGFIGVQPVAVDVAHEHTLERGGIPYAGFVAEEENASDGGRLLTLRHDGGDPIPAGDLHVVGEGFAEIPSADQTAPGPWQGEASGDLRGRSGEFIVHGDTITIGVAADCTIRLVYRGVDEASTVHLYECGAEPDGD